VLEEKRTACLVSERIRLVLGQVPVVAHHVEGARERKKPDGAFLLAEAACTGYDVCDIRNGDGEPAATTMAIAKVSRRLRCSHSVARFRLGPTNESWLGVFEHASVRRVKIPLTPPALAPVYNRNSSTLTAQTAPKFLRVWPHPPYA